jgi:hypothetical protein
VREERLAYLQGLAQADAAALASLFLSLAAAARWLPRRACSALMLSPQLTRLLDIQGTASLPPPQVRVHRG